MTDKNCKYCFGKGWHSRAYHEVASPDFPSQQGYKKLHVEQQRCRCNQPPTFRRLSAAEVAALSAPAWPEKKPLPPADKLMRDHALREEGARSVIEALRPLLRSVTFTAEGRRVIPAEIVEALLSGKTVPEKPAFLRKCLD